MTKKIILGSSSITILKEVEWNLTETDYEIVPANDTDDFKEQIKTQNPDLFIIDRDMQEGNGASLSKEVKSSDQYSKIPVIMLVKKEEDQNEDFITKLAKESNADKVLTVPLESAKLQSTIQYLFARQSAASDPLTQTLSSTEAGAGQSPGAENVSAESPPVADLFIEPEAISAGTSPTPEAPAVERVDIEEFKIEGATPFGEEEVPAESPPVADLFIEPEAISAGTSPTPDAPAEEELDFEEFKIEGATPFGEEEVPAEDRLDLEEFKIEGANPSAEPEAVSAGTSPTPDAPAEEELDFEEFKIEGATPFGEEEVPAEASPVAEPSMGPEAVSTGTSPTPEPPVSEQPKVEETPSLTAEDALQETIKVVEDAIKRNRTDPPANAQGISAQAQPSQEKSDQSDVVQAVTAQAAAQWKPASEEPLQETEPVQETASQVDSLNKESGEDLKGTGVTGEAESWPSSSQEASDERRFEGSNHPVMAWLKDMLNEKMDPIIRQSVPEMTKKMIMDQMNKIIEESVPELTKRLLEERIAKYMDEKTLSKMIINEIDQNREFVSSLFAKEAPNIISEVAEKMVPGLAEKIIRDEIEHIKQG